MERKGTEEDDAPDLVHCPICNGTNVLVAVWPNPNKYEKCCGGSRTFGKAPVDPWCNDCGGHVKQLDYRIDVDCSRFEDIIRDREKPTSTFVKAEAGECEECGGMGHTIGFEGPKKIKYPCESCEGAE